MDSTDMLFLVSLVDHLAVVAIGAAIVWMGYRLFRDLPVQRDGQARIALPGGVSIYFSRIGPGAFFVLFGAALIGYTEAKRPFSLQIGPGTVAAQGLTARSVPQLPAPRDDPSPRPGVVRALAGLAVENDAAAVTPTQMDRGNALRVARLQVMLAGWDPAWGNAEDFRGWVDNAMMGEPPASAARAVAVFEGK